MAKLLLFLFNMILLVHFTIKFTVSTNHQNRHFKHKSRLPHRIIAVDKHEECINWYLKCDEFRRDLMKTKDCIGRTLFLYADLTASFGNSSKYCSAIFGGYSDANVLYFDLDYSTPSNVFVDQDLIQFRDLKLIPSGLVVNKVQTSAICCPIYSIYGQEVTMSFHCTWLHNGKEIPKFYYKDILFESFDTCSYLLVDLTQINLTSPFCSAISKSLDEEYPFICTYKRPEYCIPPTTTSPTTNKPKTSATTPTTTTTTTANPGKHCSQLHTEDYLVKDWPQAPNGSYSIGKCPTGTTGIAKWFCEDGIFAPEGPFINCTLSWIDKIIDNITHTKNLKQLSKQVDNFRAHIKKEPAQFPNDLKEMIKIVKIIETKFEQFASDSSVESNNVDVRNVTVSMVDSCSRMINSEQAWYHSDQLDRISIAGQMLSYIQNNGVTMGCYSLKNDTQIDLKKKFASSENIYLNAFNMDREQPIWFGHEDYSFTIKQPLHTNENVSEWCPHRMGIGVMFKKLSIYMFGQNNTQTSSIKMNSEIVAFSYNNITREIYWLPNENEAQMSLAHHERMEFGAHARCVFWNYKTESWSSEGCRIDLQKSNRNQTTCFCKHLTNFAVLLDISGQERPSKLKSILTIVFCSASIICLVLTILFFSLCRELRSRRSSIIMNISIMMIFINLLVLFGLDRTDFPVVCKGVSIALLYGMLSLFFWMLMEGYNLYQMMILIFNTKGRLQMMYLYLIGYGFPALITIGASVYMYFKTELTNEYFCWITSTKFPNQIWIVAAPGTLIILVNTVIMFRVMKIVWSKNTKYSNPTISTTRTNSSGFHSKGTQISIKKKSNKNDRNGSQTINISTKKRKINNAVSNDTFASNSIDERSNFEERISEILTYLKGFIGLIVLMGITWSSYLLYIHEIGHYFSYLFIFLNGLQGVFIFITQFLFNKKAMNAVRKRIYRMLGFDDYYSSGTSGGSSSSKNATTSSYLQQQQRTYRKQNGDENQMEIDERDYYNRNAIVDRSTSLEL